jgi:hypothetical protein
MKTTLTLIALSLYTFIGYSQTPAVHTNMITCFSQGHAGSRATNCASISVIKLAIAKYGINGVFLRIETLPGKYVIHLRNGQQTDLSADELAVMDNLNKFYFVLDSDTVKAARLMYAVMAKNKFLQHPENFRDLTAAASEKAGWLLHHYTIYQLVTDTWENFKLLGIDTSKIKKIDKSVAKNYPDNIITSLKHSAYASFGTYDEYGEPRSLPEFSDLHREQHKDLNYILLD